METRHPQADAPGTLWSAVGRPLTHFAPGKYRLTEHYLFFEKGALRTNAQQIPVHEIYDVDAKQTVTQKARGVGTITLFVQRSNGREVVKIEDIAEFREGVSELNRVAHERRLVMQTRATTQTINYSGTPLGAVPGVGGAGVSAPVSEPQQAPAPAAAEDVISQIQRLGSLHEAGVITADEFAAKKAELLSRL
ncbi:hypothetical protein SERN_1112 [Serinibacter arcticus]|uniref:SHOCT domain-containing protein n=1 Tax=Serinibacter arcticus TaxID=1655435 RepID=A0A4Z1E267_9MICO|nr:hypothetical protein SERN_1112 [Serinibacter arcticus]